MTTIDHSYVQRAYGTEHQLVTARAVSAGEPVLCERAFVSIPLRERYAYGAYSWDLVDLILSDRDLLLAYNRRRLAVTTFLQDPQDLAIEAALVRKHRKSRQLVRELCFSVGTNNIGILNDQRAVVGYGVFEKLSRADHSCMPNTRLEAADWSQGENQLVASRDIRAGEPVTWSYFREDEFLEADYLSRNAGLVNVFRFTCRCERCKAEKPADMGHLSSPRELLAYFDELLKQQAQEMMRTPGGLQTMLEGMPMAMHAAELRKPPK